MNLQRNRLLLGGTPTATAGEDDPLQTGGRLILHKNALVFNGRAIQVSSICAVYVTDCGLIRRHPLPGWVTPVGLLGVSEALLAFAFDCSIASVVGLGLIAFAYKGFRAWKPVEHIPRYALCVEMSSSTARLRSCDEAFLLRAVQAITAAIAGQIDVTQSIEFNFDNKTINVGQACGSVVAGGSVNLGSFRSDYD